MKKEATMTTAATTIKRRLLEIMNAYRDSRKAWPPIEFRMGASVHAAWIRELEGRMLATGVTPSAAMTEDQRERMLGRTTYAGIRIVCDDTIDEDAIKAVPLSDDMTRLEL